MYLKLINQKYNVHLEINIHMINYKLMFLCVYVLITGTRLTPK